LLAQKLIEKNKNFDLNNILQTSLMFRKKNHFSEKVPNDNIYKNKTDSKSVRISFLITFENKLADIMTS
jgi:hypothetical protein